MAHHAHTPDVHEHADAWHHHTSDEGLPQVEHLGVVSTAVLARWFVVIVGALTLTLVALFVYFTSSVTQLKAQIQETTALGLEARKARDEAMAVLGAEGGPGVYRWSDPAAGKVQVPLSIAKERVIARYSQRAGVP
jgi:hypothetical protein